MSVTIDALISTIAVCEHGQATTEEVTTLKADIVALKRDVDQLNSKNISIILKMVEILNDLVKLYMPTDV